MMHMGMFEHKSDDLSQGNIRFKLRSRIKTSEQPEDKKTALLLELGNLRSKTIREAKFMERVRQEAAQRRKGTRNGELHLTLTGLGRQNHKRQASSKGGRFISSARTIDGKEFCSPRQIHADVSLKSLVNRVPRVEQETRGRGVRNSKENLDMQHLVFSNATTNHSFLNS